MRLIAFLFLAATSAHARVGTGPRVGTGARVGTSAIARPSRVQLGRRVRSLQFSMRHLLPGAALITCLIASTIIASTIATATTRPRYGGTLRVMLQSTPNTLDLPTNSAPADYWDAVRLLSLVGDNLVTVDPQDRAHPALAVAWQSDATARHWQFTLRNGVKFHDGSAASAGAIAQILGALHSDWNVHSSRDALAIDTEAPAPSLLAELALPRNLILKHNAGGLPIGTGAFRVAEWQPGKLLKLAANEESWSGRPFLDAVEIEFGKSLRDQAIALELGKTDLIEASPQASASNASPRIRASLPVELMVLVFSANSKAQDDRLREALALCIDRKPIQSVLLKGAGEPAASLLPNWMTGYSSVFSAQANVQRAKVVLAGSRQPDLNLSYDPRDPQAQLVAERIALNAREAGITVQVSLSGADDLRLVRVVLPSADPATSLREAARQLGLPQPVVRSNAVEDLYQAEHTLLDGHPVIPLFHLPVASAATPRVRAWAPDRLGGWNLQDLWLEDSR
jgi:ABC-type transport system substrate-binding protein